MRTKITAVVMIGSLTVAVALTRVSLMGVATAEHIGSYFLVGFPLLTAVWCWWCAAEMASASMRWQWVLFGAAAVAFGIAQLLEEFFGQTPTGRITSAQILYLTAIVAFGAGLSWAVHSFKGFLDLRKPLFVSASVAAIATVVGVATLAGLYARIEVALADKILLAVYPMGVLWLQVAQALALALTVSQMGGGSLARPWWAVFIGVSLIAVSNVILIVITALDVAILNSGPMEIGWWIGLSMVSVGAAMQIDLQKPAARASA